LKAKSESSNEQKDKLNDIKQDEEDKIDLENDEIMFYTGEKPEVLDLGIIIEYG